MAGCAALTALTLAVLPYGLKKGLQYWLLQNGADTVRIADLSLNPFLGRLGIQDMLVESNGKKVLANSKVAIDLSLTGLLTKKVRVEKAVYDNISLDIEQLADGRWRLSSYTTALGKTAPPEEDPSSPWHFSADEMLFTNCRFQLKLPDLQVTLQVNAAELRKISNLPDGGSGSFLFKGIVNDAPVELTIDTLMLSPQLSLTGTFKTRDIHLEQFTKILSPLLQSLDGAVEADGRFSLMIPQTAPPRFVFDGKLSVSNPAMQRPDIAVTGKKLEWQGSIALDGDDASRVLNLDGTLTGTAIAADTSGRMFAIKGNEFRVSGPIRCNLGANAHIASQAGISVTEAKVSLPSSSLSFNTFTWQGEAGYSAEAGQAITTIGAMKVGDLVVSHTKGPEAVRVPPAQENTPTAAPEKSSAETGQPTPDQADSGQVTTMAARTIDWGGKIAYRQDKARAINIDGQLKSAGTILTLPSPQLRVEQEGCLIDAQGTVITQGEKRPQLKGKGTIALTRTTLLQLGNTSSVPIGSLASLKTEITASEEARIAADAFILHDLKVQIPDPLPMIISLPQTTISGVLAKNWSHLEAAALTSTEIQAHSPRTKATIASLAQLRLEKPQFTAELGMNTASLQLDELTILPPQEKEAPPPLVQMKQGQGNTLRWQREQGLRIEEIFLNDLRLQIVRAPDGQLQINKQLLALQTVPRQKEDAATTGATAPKKAGPNVTVKTLQVRGNSALHFEDQSLAEPFISETAIQQLEISNLSTANPDQPAKVTLQALLAQRAPLTITGTLNPFLSAPEVNGRISLKNYPLARLSPYTVQSVGLALASGQLNLQSTLEIGKGQINMKNGVVLKKIETKTMADDLAKKLDNQLPLPLDTAISFLKDSNDDIALDIPIRGSLAKLDVGLSDILITALGKAIVPAASSYLMYALGPYGALAYVGLKVGEKIMRASLAPVIFQPMAKTLTSEHTAYLERVATILRERPNLEINLCPIVPTWETDTLPVVNKPGGNQPPTEEALHQQLVQLGQERAQAVINHLVTRHTIEQSRLMICETMVTTERIAVPEVALQL